MIRVTRCPNVVMRSGTYPSFVFRLCARRAHKRNTDKMRSTLLPQATDVGFVIGLTVSPNTTSVVR